MGQDTKAWQSRQSITAQEDVSILGVSLQGDGIVDPGETVIDARLSAKDGEVRQVLGFAMDVDQPENSTTGTYSIEIQSLGSNVSYLFGASNHDTDLEFDYFNWTLADADQQPPSAAAQTQAVKGMRYGDGNDLQIKLSNDTDGSIPYITPQPSTLRNYYFFVKRQEISL